MKSEGKVSIAIVEDGIEMRDFLVDLFNDNPEFICQDVYTNGEDALAFMPQHSIDVAIMDIGLPGISGIECVKELKSKMPNTQFVMLTVFETEEQIFNSLKVGAIGYLLKKTAGEKIIGAIKEVLRGGSPMSASIARKVTEYFQSLPIASQRTKIEILTNRERELLQNLSTGLLYKEIAIVMNITTGTVKQHIHKIYKKLQVQNKTEAINKFLKRS